MPAAPRNTTSSALRQRLPAHAQQRARPHRAGGAAALGARELGDGRRARGNRRRHHGSRRRGGDRRDGSRGRDRRAACLPGSRRRQRERSARSDNVCGCPQTATHDPPLRPRADQARGQPDAPWRPVAITTAGQYTGQSDLLRPRPYVDCDALCPWPSAARRWRGTRCSRLCLVVSLQQRSLLPQSRSPLRGRSASQIHSRWWAGGR